ncbi:MAG: Hsp20/alpha crystallin family protein [Lachnospiraceae bacterium]|nr:Hsp20/alpha crystallin family protein [Lachnospiraceae bacterium]
MLVPSIFSDNFIDDFFDDFSRPANPMHGLHTPAAIMKTDVRETEKGYELDIDLPGYKKEDIQAELKDGNLTISATMKQDNDEKDKEGNYIRRERFYGNCSRTFYVGEDIEQGDISAKFEDGILRVSVPKKDPKPQVEEKKLIAIN